MLFGRKIHDKLPSIHQPMEVDEEVADKDKEQKEKGKQYADARRHAKVSDIGVGDDVLVKRMTRANKLSSNFEIHSRWLIREAAKSRSRIRHQGRSIGVMFPIYRKSTGQHTRRQQRHHLWISAMHQLQQ